ncbi:MAG: tetratricopeptide repeat protein, partial [Flavobacteriales bacterium]
MADLLHQKLAVLDGYALAALERLAVGAHGDALNNMRKAAEAACKVLLMHALPAKQAGALMEGSTMWTLLEAVQRHARVPSEVINHLKALQIHGNKGVHDGVVSAGSTMIGAVHLRALVQWLHMDRLQLPMPKGLAKAMSDEDPQAAIEAARRAQETEQRATLERMAATEERLTRLSEQAQRSDAEKSALADELKAMRTSLAQQAEWRAELEHLKQVVETPPAPNAPEVLQPSVPIAKRPWRRVALVVSIIVVVAAAAVYLTGHGSREDTANETVLAPPADTVLRVVLLSFNVIQDDPNVQLRFEEVLRKQVQEHATKFHIPAEILVMAHAGSRTLTAEEAVHLADSLHARLLFHGEIAEPTATDSGTVALHYVMRRVQDVETEAYPPLRFRTLTEQATEVLVATAGNLMDRAMANVHAGRGEWSRALALLYASEATTDRAEYLNRVFRVDCHMRLKQFDEALRESGAVTAMAPDNYYGWMLAGNALKAQGRIPEARGAYEEALKRAPSRIDLLLDLADLCVDVNDPRGRDSRRARELVERAMEVDSTSARVRFYMASAEYLVGNWPEAAAAYQRAIALGYATPQARVNLAELLLFRLKQPDAKRAEALLLEAYRADSTDPKALYMLGELYTKSALKDPVKAKDFYTRSLQRAPQAEWENKLGLAIAAMDQNRSDEAADLLSPLWQRDSSNVRVGQVLGNALLNSGRHREALLVLERLLAIDPLDHEANYNMGYIRFFGEASVRDPRKAVLYFNEALRTDPLDSLALEYTGNALVELHDPLGAEPFLRRAVAITPRAYGANRGLALVLDELGHSKDAIPYYEKALAARPDDDLVLSNLAYIYLADGPTRDVAKALAFA